MGPPKTHKIRPVQGLNQGLTGTPFLTLSLSGALEKGFCHVSVSALRQPVTINFPTLLFQPGAGLGELGHVLGKAAPLELHQTSAAQAHGHSLRAHRGGPAPRLGRVLSV